jgi:hypothetical protein
MLDDLNRAQAQAEGQLRFLDGRSASSMLDDLNRAQAQAEAQLRLLDGRLASSLLDDVYRARREVESQLHGLELGSTALEAAMRPLPDISRFTSNPSLWSIEDATRRLSAAFLSARVLGQFDFEGTPQTGETPSDTSAEEEVEENLVRLVPAEALVDLQRVGFAPILLLDRVLRNPTILHQISDRDFEGFVATLVDELGFEDVILTRRSADGGRDVLAKQRLSGIEILFAFECKHYSPDKPVGIGIARALFGTIAHCDTRANIGVLVTTSRFTKPARRFILTELSLDGKDFADVIEWLREYARKRQRRDGR